MSDRYPFTDDKTLVTHGGAVVWSEQVAAQSSLHFSNVSTLSDSMNESFVTAVDENETQYLSVLETTNDITLEDLHNITLGNSKVVQQESIEFSNENLVDNMEENTVDTGTQQVVVFSVEGSDDLYGIQFAPDEEGIMQKYQFKFRTTEDGQLEAIPESIQLLLNDDDSDQKTNDTDEVLVQEVESEEVQETQVFFQNEGEGEEVRETQVFFQNEHESEEVQETQVFLQNEAALQEGNVLHEEDEPAEEHGQPEKSDCGRLQIYIKGEPEHQLPALRGDGGADIEYSEVQEAVEELQYEQTRPEFSEKNRYTEETIDVKAGILEEQPVNIKRELYKEECQESSATSAQDEALETEGYKMFNDQAELETQCGENNIHEGSLVHELEQHVEENIDGNYVEIDEARETVLEYEQYIPEGIQQVFEETTTDTTDSQSLQTEQDDNHYEQLFIQENHILANGKNAGSQSVELVEEEEEQAVNTFVTETGVEIDSDNDDYQIVEGLHITAEGDVDEESSSPVQFQEPETILQEVLEKPPAPDRANILKQPPLIKTIRDVKNKNKTIVYYVVPHVEKENVNSLPVNNTTIFRQVRSNPRSILKSSFPEIQEPEIKNVVDERFSKRFARSKEAVQARLFNNFISKTTIPHAPVRQTRLPRKQEIKPVGNRRDEEIIVQEVMVSSNGFVENVEERLRNKDKLEVTGYVVLTDSDDDYDPKQGTRKKKKHKKHKKVDMSDSEESEVSVIDICSDDDDEPGQYSPKRGRGRPKKCLDAKEKNESMKRRRGRPPKQSQNQNETEESPQKKSRTESDDMQSDTAKKEIECPNCTKTFPSENSLSTHIQHHNLENSLRSSQASKSRSSVRNPTIEFNHKCDACQVNFKNSILLKRHVCEKIVPKNSARLSCTFCKKSFPDLSSLNVHKRCHVKENLVNTTTVAKVSPKKFLPRPSTSKFKSPTSLTTVRANNFKCKICSRVCFSREGLNLHEETHRKFTCKGCKAAFTSRILLDTHIRASCVKASTSVNKRLSFKISKTFVHSPKRKPATVTRKSVRSSVNTNVNTTMNATMNTTPNSTSHLSLDCNRCQEKFTWFQDLFKHQVKVHGLSTPDKSILTEEKKNLLHHPKTLHGGIQTREGMKTVFANLRSKIALATSTKDDK